MKKPKPLRPQEGNVVSITLEDGRLALGVLARVETAHPRKPYGIFVYFLGPYYNLNGLQTILQTLSAAASITWLKTSALDIYRGKWKIVGVVPNWNRVDWPYPDFYFQDDFTEKLYRRKLSEHDLGTPLNQSPIAEVGDLRRDEHYGAEAARFEVSAQMKNLPAISTLSH